MTEQQLAALTELEELSREELIRIIHFSVELVNKLRAEQLPRDQVKWQGR